MRRRLAVAAALAALGLPPALAAREPTLFAVSLGAGLAGPLDDDAESSFDSPVVQLAAGMLTDDRTWTVLRLGRVEFASDEVLDGLSAARLDYATVAGEYRFRQAAYELGLFTGLGLYRLDGDALAGATGGQEALGVVLGFTGDFDVSRRVSVVGEVDFHYAFLDEVKFYGAALAGVAVHF